MEPQALSTRGAAQVSVVIPCEPGGDPSACLEALAALAGPERALIRDVWLAWGRRPGLQRNAAVREAKGAWILFLDADSRAQPGLISTLLKAVSGPRTAAVGGPNLALEDEGPLGLRFDAVLGSYAGSMASRARYRPVGIRRPCTEKELIGCNLLMRRRAFVEAGGFREDLYPNEENELLKRLETAGWDLVYEPDAQVRRPRRAGLAAFVAQAFGYGAGRARQLRLGFFRSDLPNLLPLGLPLLWLACFLVWALGPGPGFALWAAAPPLGYAAACLLAAGLRPSVALFLALRHHAYAGGLAWGFLRRAAPRPEGLRLERVPLLRTPERMARP